MTAKAMDEEAEQGEDSGNLLTPEERIECQRLTAGEDPYNQRAQALLALDEGTTQNATAQKAGLTKGQVRYWLGKFRKVGMTIFPEAPAEPVPELIPKEAKAATESELVEQPLAAKAAQVEAVVSAAGDEVAKEPAKKKRKATKKKKTKKTRKGKKVKVGKKRKNKKKSGKGKKGKKANKKKRPQKGAGGKKQKKKKNTKLAGKKGKKKS